MNPLIDGGVSSDRVLPTPGYLFGLCGQKFFAAPGMYFSIYASQYSQKNSYLQDFKTALIRNTAHKYWTILFKLPTHLSKKLFKLNCSIRKNVSS
jgi:hypothetical protein